MRWSLRLIIIFLWCWLRPCNGDADDRCSLIKSGARFNQTRITRSQSINPRPSTIESIAYQVAFLHQTLHCLCRDADDWWWDTNLTIFCSYEAWTLGGQSVSQHNRHNVCLITRQLNWVLNPIITVLAPLYHTTAVYKINSTMMMSTI